MFAKLYFSKSDGNGHYELVLNGNYTPKWMTVQGDQGGVWWCGGVAVIAENVIGFWRDRRIRNVSRKHCWGLHFAIIVFVCVCARFWICNKWDLPSKRIWTKLYATHTHKLPFQLTLLKLATCTHTRALADFCLSSSCSQPTVSLPRKLSATCISALGKSDI